jgi:hypothetical protein
MSFSECSGLPAATRAPKVTPDTCRIGVVSRIGSHSTLRVCTMRNTGYGICAMV